LERPVTSNDIVLTLTAQEAAAGVVITVPLPTGPVRLRIPPARDGDLVRARVGDQVVQLRIRVSETTATMGGAPSAPSAPSAPAPPAPRRSGPLGCLVGLAVAAVVIIAATALADGDDGSDSAAPSPTYSRYSPSPRPALPTGAATLLPTAEPSPYDPGTCLTGTLPNATTPTRVDDDVREVPCSASGAHYRVIERFNGTTEMNRCNGNPRTEYRFSARYSRGATVTSQYVYCLVGIGSYARG
jgi:hypothetical protein